VCRGRVCSCQRGNVLLRTCWAACRLDGPKGEWCVYNITSPEGRLSPDYPISISRPQMMHDFAISENYAIFIDSALIFDPKNMVRSGGMPFVTDKSRPSRIGLVRKAEPEKGVLKWFEVPPFTFFHTINAWEEADGRVCVALCRCAHIFSVD
jgi:carotenoid cleavage dioxygenase-like enzyme